MNAPKPLGKVNSYRDLVVWQKARSLATEAYRLCMTPSFERHRGLSDQIMRTALSIPSNIAEAIGIIPRHMVGQIAAQLDEVARLLGGTIKMRKAREDEGE